MNRGTRQVHGAMAAEKSGRLTAALFSARGISAWLRESISQYRTLFKNLLDAASSRVRVHQRRSWRFSHFPRVTPGRYDLHKDPEFIAQRVNAVTMTRRPRTWSLFPSVSARSNDTPDLWILPAPVGPFSETWTRVIKRDGCVRHRGYNASFRLLEVVAA